MIKVKVDPIEKDFKVWLDQALGPKAQSKAFAAFARDTIDEATAINTKALGRTPEHEHWVDGRRGAPLESVKPEGRIIAEWDFLEDAMVWIRDQLEAHSPYKSGRYKRSHKFFVDGREADPERAIAVETSAWFVSIVPYARKLEKFKAAGVYQAVAKLAAGRFGNIARVRFTYRDVTSDEGKTERNPAIVLTPR